ncbi:unnamed protein product [Coccothraustes coccothraustes]
MEIRKQTPIQQVMSKVTAMPESRLWDKHSPDRRPLLQRCCLHSYIPVCRSLWLILSMLEVLDDAINLGDESDAPLTLAQWLRCRRKPRGSPANRLPLNRARRAQAVASFTSRS